MKAIILADSLGNTNESKANNKSNQKFAQLLEQLKIQGASEVVLSISNSKIKDHFGNSHNGVLLKYSVDTQPAGTGGAITNALWEVNGNEPVLILNDTSSTKLDYKEIISSHKNSGSKITVVSHHDNLESYVINIDIFDNFKLPEMFSFEDFINENLSSLKPNSFILDNKNIKTPEPLETV